MKHFLEWQCVIRQFQAIKLIFVHAIKAMWPAVYKRKSPVDKAAKVGVQVPAKVKFLFCFFFQLLVYDLIKNEIQDLIYR